ncbi:MAG: OB-fold nucleic acid binding domain-containing protein, partial [Planctomycetota bacterium]
MQKISIRDARQAAAIGQQVLVQGWVRTRRDSKGGFSFLELNDGSCLGNLQVIADGALANYESEIKELAGGASVAVEGVIAASVGGGQATELKASKVTVVGPVDPEAYQLQKKRHSFEKLREWAHLRPRTNTFGAIARVRNCVCNSIHQFFQEQGFLYVHTPIIT